MLHSPRGPGGDGSRPLSAIKVVSGFLIGFFLALLVEGGLVELVDWIAGSQVMMRGPIWIAPALVVGVAGAITFRRMEFSDPRLPSLGDAGMRFVRPALWLTLAMLLGLVLLFGPLGERLFDLPWAVRVLVFLVAMGWVATYVYRRDMKRPDPDANP